MIEFILIYIALSIIISVVSHLSEGFKGTRELNIICSLCVICVVLIPLSKSIPDIINNSELFDVDSETSFSSDSFDKYQDNITENIEVSVKELIANEYGINAEVKASINFDDMSAMRLEGLEIITDDSTNNAQIYKFLKSIFFCEVRMYEK